MTASHESLYGRRADLYDRIYHWKDYAKEAEVIHTLLRESGVREGGRVCEAACGTGSYLVHLRDWYEASGCDLNPATLEVARQKVPDVDLFESDMAHLSLKRPVDAILCLFSSIGYVYPEERLRTTAQAFYDNLLPGGVAVVEPWLSPEAGADGHFAQQTYESETLKLCRAGVHRVDGRRSHLAFHWLVTSAQGVEHFVDEHTLWMYTRAEMVDAFETAGFEVSWRDEGLMPGRGLLVATRGR